MSGSGNGSCRSYAAFSALGNHEVHVGNRVFAGVIQPLDDNSMATAAMYASRVACEAAGAVFIAGLLSAAGCHDAFVRPCCTAARPVNCLAGGHYQQSLPEINVRFEGLKLRSGSEISDSESHIPCCGRSLTEPQIATEGLNRVPCNVRERGDLRSEQSAGSETLAQRRGLLWPVSDRATRDVPSEPRASATGDL